MDLGGLRIHAGRVDFLTIRLGEGPVAAMLGEMSANAGLFAPLFDGNTVADVVRRQFAEANAPDAALVIRSVQVGGPLRCGQDLAAWMVSQVIDRKLPTANGFGLMRADSGDAGNVPAVRDAQGSLPSAHDWRRTGLTPLQGDPRYLGQSTNGPALDIARAGLGGADRFRIRVHVNDVERLTRGG